MTVRFSDSSLRTTVQDHEALIQISGQLNGSFAPSLRGCVKNWEENPPLRATLDLSGVYSFDSVGLGALHGAIQSLRSTGCRVELASAAPGIERAMRVLALDVGLIFVNDNSAFASERQ